MLSKRSILVLCTRREPSVEVLGLAKVNAAYICFLSGVLGVDTPTVSSDAFLLPIDDFASDGRRPCLLSPNPLRRRPHALLSGELARSPVLRSPHAASHAHRHPYRPPTGRCPPPPSSQARAPAIAGRARASPPSSAHSSSLASVAPHSVCPCSLFSPLCHKSLTRVSQVPVLQLVRRMAARGPSRPPGWYQGQAARRPPHERGLPPPVRAALCSSPSLPLC
jgi:hypothetical protein